MAYEPKVIIGKKYLDVVIPLLAAARHSIEIIIYEVRLREKIPTHEVSLLLRALQDAAQRGVRVRAIVGNALIAERLRAYGLEAKTLHTGKLMHAKVVLIDRYIAVVGSHNFTQSAFRSNLEVSLAVEFSLQGNDLGLYFDRLWGL